MLKAEPCLNRYQEKLLKAEQYLNLAIVMREHSLVLFFATWRRELSLSNLCQVLWTFNYSMFRTSRANCSL